MNVSVGGTLFSHGFAHTIVPQHFSDSAARGYLTFAGELSMEMHVRHLTIGLVAGVLASGLPVSPLSAQANRDMPSRADSVLVTDESRALIEADAARASVLTTRQPVALRSVRVHRDSTERGLPAPSPRTEHGSDLALMGVGGAAVVVGLLVGDDAGAAVAIGGGVVGLIGLYRYLR